MRNVCSECGSTDIRKDENEWYCNNCGMVIRPIYDTEREFQTIPEVKIGQRLHDKRIAHNERMKNKQMVARKSETLEYFDKLCEILKIEKITKDELEKDFNHLYDAFWNSKHITGRGWSRCRIAETILYTLLINKFRSAFIQITEFFNKPYIFGNETIYDENRLSFLNLECRKFMELSQNLQDYCKSKEVDVEHNAVIWGKKFTNQEFYYENNKIDPSIENIRNTLGFENFLDVNNNLILQELFSFTLTNAWALFYIIVNKHQPNHKMTGLLCACLYSECEKMAKPLKIKLKKKLYWAKLFGITYETLNLRLRKLKTMQNL